ncbi:hypothetical protein BDR03DRAFT_1003531 [Suillus americanus]|nr:hypothetical protein BDR03DRAFT_1003531 [Suillus americanus]
MQQHLKDQLVELRQCLKALPTDIPVPLAIESKYKFSNFSPDAEWTIDIGEAERGPETEAIVDVLETWIKKCPGDIILEKWVHDILEAVQSVILAAGKPLPKSLYQSNDNLDIELASKKKKIKIVGSDVSVMHLYTDAKHIPAKGKGGAKADPLMDLLSVNTYLTSNPKKIIVWKLVDVLADKDLAPAVLRSTVFLLLASTIVQERVLTEADWDTE